MKLKVVIQWTETAKQGLKRLPKKVRLGLLSKADALCKGDPRTASKPLTGPLQGCYRILYARYRAIYTVREETADEGQKVLHLTVLFLAAGMRKERDKNDIYRLAQRLVALFDERRADEARGE